MNRNDTDKAPPTGIAMYLGAMDHSPAEQLGKPTQWHTTVIVLSEGGEHVSLARAVAKRLGCRDERLIKWSRNPSYRKHGTFETALTQEIRGYPVYIRAISARASTIKECYPHFIKDLRLQGLAIQVTKNNKPYLKFGPFARVKVEGATEKGVITRSEPVEFDIIESQALPLLFICHFALRVHQALMLTIKSTRPALEWIDWQLMHNKFPGDHQGPMGSLFGAIMSGAASARLIAGSMRVGTFNNAKDDEGNALADNVAGYLTEQLHNEVKGAFASCGDKIVWEIWEPEPRE
jgi:hypothetical protein